MRRSPSPSLVNILLFFLLTTARFSLAHDIGSTRVVISMKAVMPPSAGVRVKTAGGPDANRASVHLSLSPAKSSSSTPELNCTLHSVSPAKTSGVCNLHSSVSWGIATFTLEAF